MNETFITIAVRIDELSDRHDAVAFVNLDASVENFVRYDFGYVGCSAGSFEPHRNVDVQTVLSAAFVRPPAHDSAHADALDDSAARQEARLKARVHLRRARRGRRRRAPCEQEKYGDPYAAPRYPCWAQASLGVTNVYACTFARA